MPVYPDLGLIFVHIPKTAGSALVRGVFHGHAQAGSDSLLSRALAFLPVPQPLHRVHLGRHATALEIRRRIGADIFARYLSVAVVRDPYDRAISYYEFMRQRPRYRRHDIALRQSFTDFLRAEPDRRMLQHLSVTDRQGDVIVSEVLRFEALTDGVAKVFDRLGLPAPAMPPPRNPTVRAPADTYLTDEAVALINRRAARDFQLFGYLMR